VAIPWKSKSLILFDGYCNLCSRSVRFILKYDKKENFIFSPLSGEIGQGLIQKLKIPKETDSIVLIQNDKYFVRSEAIIKISGQLGSFFKLALIFKFLPSKWLDSIYNWVAANRFKWFGKRDSCIMPKPEHKNRFL